MTNRFKERGYPEDVLNKGLSLIDNKSRDELLHPPVETKLTRIGWFLFQVSPLPVNLFPKSYINIGIYLHHVCPTYRHFSNHH
ncbi:hypothetical protein XELAEV_18027964mg [Xenopus laevis]|uniref:Uncharacterized protein n=1 Tax=Xenopus laevis TaxID=8355 RepID=A0A974HKP6_XENLA|nr:hypothetical protein XELAEV_18027964mg [Xenopus laevis]